MNGTSKLNAALACAAFLSLFPLSSTATACATFHELDLNYMGNAQVVVRARMISYQPLFDPEIQERRRRFVEALGKNASQDLIDRLSERSADSIRIKLEVVETISGVPPLQYWEAIWVHSTFTMPEHWAGRKNVIVGLRGAVDRHGAPFVQVVQQPCAPSMIFEDEPGNRKLIMDAVSAERRRHSGYVFQ